MTDRTRIEWCDSTFNPWTGCTKISPACDHCYAEALSKRAPKSIAPWGSGEPRRRTSPANWRKPLAWDAQAFAECSECGWRGEHRATLAGVAKASNGICPGCGALESTIPARRRVFCASLADVFDNEVDPRWRHGLFDLIAATPNLDWLLLTKRIGNAISMLTEQERRAAARYRESPYLSAWLDGFPRNVWLGATICNQDEADRDIPKLLAVPARLRFLSIEPMLGPINLDRIHECGVDEGCHWDRWESCISGRAFDPWSDGETDGWPKVDWVIAGGESGPHARPSHPDWFRSLRDQCAAASVPFLFKQWGEFAPTQRTMDEVARSERKLVPVDFSETQMFPVALVDRVGKKSAGRLLDGVEHNGFPEARA